METPHLLLAEDDPNFGIVLRDYLELHDYRVTLCNDGCKGISAFRKGQYDLCILDVMMPEKDGFTLAREIKRLNQEVPLIFLTAKAMKEDMLEGFKIGADDYITKPFDSEVLLYKIKAVLNRKNGSKAAVPAPTDFNIGQYHFQPKLRLLSRQGQEQRLSPKEADLLRLLCQHLNDVMPREEALQLIWQEDTYFTARSMDVYIAKLRKYLKQDPSVEIINIHGQGYRLCVHNGIML
ncbi:DNA-binding response OmpR family regulator [Pontibacter ummariensis]|uniref:DNA-binding response regulator, OmpR family, contains REC and winged-helix (WHTH) domain n=1 Tax=Pontibacter ummariensis TaxID=1610492 RepID=A0A239GDG2_9BACT|nr:response regulator transcription factor [Pontibacter ummariensis]PRY11207.1 DNA-binding response OmpR family regulator [Pontibacter ummariensis]SNS67091.1 DNA-binding response regulator, OmpR family, contains REC and winged-helix (wHTH) domain [Pontibacter ummariensis]